MSKPNLSLIFAQSKELTRLSGEIKTVKKEILEAFPQVLRMTPCIPDENTTNGAVMVWVSEFNEGLEEALQAKFGDIPVTLSEMGNMSPEKFPIVRALYETDISDVLDRVRYMSGFYSAIKEDEQGVYLEVQLGEDQPSTRQLLEDAYPDIRIVFKPHTNKLSIGIAPS